MRPVAIFLSLASTISLISAQTGPPQDCPAGNSERCCSNSVDHASIDGATRDAITDAGIDPNTLTNLVGTGCEPTSPDTECSDQLLCCVDPQNDSLDSQGYAINCVTADASD